MIRPYSLDAETITLLQRLVVAAYGRRDDLYVAAEQLDEADLAAICHKLADDLAGHTAHLQQIIAMHGRDPAVGDAISSALSQEIIRLLRKTRGERGVVSAVEQEQGKLREQYDATIATVHDPEAQAVLETQKRDVDFGQRVLRQCSQNSENAPSGESNES